MAYLLQALTEEGRHWINQTNPRRDMVVTSTAADWCAAICVHSALHTAQRDPESGNCLHANPLPKTLNAKTWHVPLLASFAAIRRAFK